MAVSERMRRELGDPVFEAWIGPLSLESFDHDELKIGAAKPQSHVHTVSRGRSSGIGRRAS